MPFHRGHGVAFWRPSPERRENPHALEYFRRGADGPSPASEEKAGDAPAVQPRSRHATLVRRPSLRRTIRRFVARLRKLMRATPVVIRIRGARLVVGDARQENPTRRLGLFP